MQNQLHSGGTVGRLIIDAITRFADRPVLADGHVAWTYRELGRQIGLYMAFYRSLGLGKGSGIAMVTGNRAEAWASVCAANILGMRHTHLHPMAGEDDHAQIIDDAKANVLVVDGRRFAARGQALKARCRSLEHLVSFGPVEGAHDITAAAETLEPAELVEENEPEDTVLLTYTGGTTGRSKGIMLPHRALAAMTLTIAGEWEWPSTLRYLAMTPISHSAGIKLYPIMLRGGYARMIDGFDKQTFCEVVEAERITATFLVPTIITTLLQDRALLQRHDLSSLELIIYGAAPMSPDRLREATELFGPVFMQLYGQSEAPECITTLRRADHDLSRPERLGSCGKPTALCEVKLLDSELNEVALGEPGEICVRGPLVMNGYWGLPELTAETFRGGWLHTGDVARRDAEGYLYIVDRTKDMIISGGFNIYPREVEDVLASHPAVVSAGVIGVPDPKWGEAVKAFVTLRDGRSATEAELQAFVKERRGAPWSPKSVEFVTELPLTGLGKLDRKALRAPYWEGQTRAVS
ncbi:AMP-binding protein [Rhodoligotrophos ferricapiens]|uniref:AMP-binding protein n=1 Tax=Rhodoligotrophos ferricapiens TaxID=3069264 RepID=UPI00315D7669